MRQLITGKGENRFHFSLPTVAAGKTTASFDSFLHGLMCNRRKIKTIHYLLITKEGKLLLNPLFMQINGTTKRVHQEIINMDLPFINDCH